MKYQNMKNILLLICSFLILKSAVEKFIRTPEKTEAMARINFSQQIDMLAICDLLLLAAFLFRPTRKAGFILSICFFSGALATRLSTGLSPWEAVIILVSLFAAMFASDPGMFLNSPGRKDSLT